MIFRCRQYRVAPDKREAFNEFFRTRLLPVQQRYGARLVGRWQSEDGEHLLALWVYESVEAYENVQEKVRLDPDSAEAQRYRREHLNPLYIETEEWLMTSTVPLGVTELAHLVDFGSEDTRARP